MERQVQFSLIRYCFIGLNGLIIMIGIVFIYIGNINFTEKKLISGSFFGGYMASTSLIFVVYGALGAYGAFKRERVIIIIYASIAVVWSVTRLLLWVLGAMHGIKLEPWNYTYVAAELTNILMSTLFNYLLE